MKSTGREAAEPVTPGSNGVITPGSNGDSIVLGQLSDHVHWCPLISPPMFACRIALRSANLLEPLFLHAFRKSGMFALLVEGRIFTDKASQDI